MRNGKYKAYVIIAAVLWGMISVFSTPLKNSGISPKTIVFIRSWGSAVVLWSIFAIKDRSAFKINIKDLWMFVGTGIISFVIFNLCYFIALEQTTTAVSVVLLYTSPIFVLILSAVLFGERMTAVKIAALIATICGCICVSGLASGSLNGTAFGIICGVGSGFFYGLYSIFGRAALNKYNSFTVTLYTFLFAAIASLFMVDFSEIGIVFNNSTAAVNSILLVLFSTITPFLLYTKGLSGVETGVAAILAIIEPMVGVLIGFVLFDEKINFIKITGVVLIIGATLILNIRSNTNE